MFSSYFHYKYAVIRKVLVFLLMALNSFFISLSYYVSPCVSLCLPVFPCDSLCTHVYLCFSLCIYVSLCVSQRHSVSLCVSQRHSVSLCVTLCLSVSLCVFLSLSITFIVPSLSLGNVNDIQSDPLEHKFLFCSFLEKTIVLDSKDHLICTPD